MGTHPSDDELLENAIPIDAIEDNDADPIPVAEAIDDEHVPTMDLAPETGIAEPASSDGGASKIRSFGEARKPHDEHWNRTPNATGQGAIHVKTFFCKLRSDGIAHMDEQINQWLDAHPEYEVKFTTSTVGPLVGKTKEDALFVQVWV